MRRRRRLGSSVVGEAVALRHPEKGERRVKPALGCRAGSLDKQ